LTIECARCAQQFTTARHPTNILPPPLPVDQVRHQAAGRANVNSDVSTALQFGTFLCTLVLTGIVLAFVCGGCLFFAAGQRVRERADEIRREQERGGGARPAPP
jgi:hypothetical protein